MLTLVMLLAQGIITVQFLWFGIHFTTDEEALSFAAQSLLIKYYIIFWESFVVSITVDWQIVSASKKTIMTGTAVLLINNTH